MKILGLILIRNEDLYIKSVVSNIYHFCDEIIILDNHSTDETFDILEKIYMTDSKVRLIKIDNVLDSHKIIERYANTDTWIFGVDGDELYYKEGLVNLRTEIVAGKYNDYWQIKGHSYHVVDLDDKEKSLGYITPASRSVTKLFNFSVLDSWVEPASERLHGKNIIFREEFNRDKLIKDFTRTIDWQNSDFKCLHLCFMKRSSSSGRNSFNPTENSKIYFPIVNFLRNILMLNLRFNSAYKNKNYRRGELIELNISDFFRESN